MRNKYARIPDPNSFISNPGSKYQIQYKPIVQKDGTIKLVESGKINIEEYINSFAESTDMAYILQQIKLGNFDILNQRTASYGDFTEVPKTMAEFQQRLIDGTNAFNSLPAHVRNQYDNDLWKFMADTGSEKWLDVMKDFLPSDKKIVDSEVKEDA